MSSERRLEDLPALAGAAIEVEINAQADAEYEAGVIADVSTIVTQWVVSIQRSSPASGSRPPTGAELQDLDDRLASYVSTAPWHPRTEEGHPGHAGTSTPGEELPPPPPHGSGEGDAAYVADVKQQLVDAGVNLRGSGAFQITRRVAWGLRGGGAGLLSKTSGNNVQGYATDIVCYQDGRAYDVLLDGGNRNIPTWNATSVPDLVSGNRWRPPF